MLSLFSIIDLRVGRPRSRTAGRRCCEQQRLERRTACTRSPSTCPRRLPATNARAGASGSARRPRSRPRRLASHCERGAPAARGRSCRRPAPGVGRSAPGRPSSVVVGAGVERLRRRRVAEPTCPQSGRRSRRSTAARRSPSTPALDALRASAIAGNGRHAGRSARSGSVCTHGTSQHRQTGASTRARSTRGRNPIRSPAR